MINNLELFKFSLQNPEPIMDEEYVKKGSLIISAKAESPTTLMMKNAALIEGITGYAFAKKVNETTTMNKALDTILELINSQFINYSEFISFWPVVDISHSIFKKIDPTQQKEVLRKIVEKYIELRHSLYTDYGYLPTTLQVGKDAKAHKETGGCGSKKIRKILENAGFTEANSNSVKEFIDGEKKYLDADKKGKTLFKNLLEDYGIKFLSSSDKEGKMPDFLIRYKKTIIILEHKHLREGGGGQDKQVNELISFINFSEAQDNVHYVSFLDGIYFNFFIKSSEKNKNSVDIELPKKNKVSTQLHGIEKNLQTHCKNYFVNTAGFKKLIKDLSR